MTTSPQSFAHSQLCRIRVGVGMVDAHHSIIVVKVATVIAIIVVGII